MEDILSVSQLTAYIREVLISDPHLQQMVVRGEVSNYYRHSSSGHIYFTLKDQQAKLKAVLFSNQAQKIDFDLQEGSQVVAKGRINVYQPRGEYQIQVTDLKQAGKGELQIAFEQLKKKLDQKGLFAKKHKQAIPQVPQSVGVITSPTGAAIQDIISVIQRRFSNTSLLIAPATVQGNKAEASLLQALDLLHNYDLDVIIIGRGGGSLEDLWAFNQEELARAIFASEIPIISAVGHETDYTIADHVADLRAATPSAAAELVVVDRQEIKRYLDRLKTNLYQAITDKITASQERLKYLLQRRAFTRPEDNWSLASQRVDELSDRLDKALTDNLADQEERLNSIMDQLHSLSPLQILERGYSLSRKQNKLQTEIKSVNQVTANDLIEVVVQDGKLHCKVEDVITGKIEDFK